MKCKCPSCSKNPDPRYTEAWRLETEARNLLRMSRPGRIAYIESVEKQRGKTAAMELKTMFLKIWESR